MNKVERKKWEMGEEEEEAKPYNRSEIKYCTFASARNVLHFNTFFDCSNRKRNVQMGARARV